MTTQASCPYIFRKLGGTSENKPLGVACQVWHHQLCRGVKKKTTKSATSIIPFAQLIRIGGVGDPAARSTVRHRLRHTFERALEVDGFHPPSSSFGFRHAITTRYTVVRLSVYVHTRHLVFFIFEHEHVSTKCGRGCGGITCGE